MTPSLAFVAILAGYSVSPTMIASNHGTALALSEGEINPSEPIGRDSNLPQLSAADPEKDIPVLQLGGASMKFDHLGPIIINADGTTRVSPR